MDPYMYTLGLGSISVFHVHGFFSPYIFRNRTALHGWMSSSSSLPVLPGSPTLRVSSGHISAFFKPNGHKYKVTLPEPLFDHCTRVALCGYLFAIAKE